MPDLSTAFPMPETNPLLSAASFAISKVSPSWAPPFCMMPSSISSAILSFLKIFPFGSISPAKLVWTESTNLPVLPRFPFNNEKNGILVKFLTCAPGDKTVLPYCDPALTDNIPV